MMTTHAQSGRTAISATDYLMLTPNGVFTAFAHAEPSPEEQALQAILAGATNVASEVWLQTYSHEWLDKFIAAGWIEQTSRQIYAPNLPLDKFLPYVVASLSGKRRAAIGSNEGFCLAQTGYTVQEAETMSVAAADFFAFMTRQQQRGWEIDGQAVSFFGDIRLMTPDTSFVFFWIDGNGYVLMIEGEPLTNNRALVTLVWGIRMAAHRFTA